MGRFIRRFIESVINHRNVGGGHRVHNEITADEIYANSKYANETSFGRPHSVQDDVLLLKETLRS